MSGGADREIKGQSPSAISTTGDNKGVLEGKKMEISVENMKNVILGLTGDSRGVNMSGDVAIQGGYDVAERS